MANPAIQAVERSVHSRADLRAMRKEGKVPGVVYGRGKATTHVAVDERELSRLLGQGSQALLIDLLLNGKKATALIKEVQRAPVSEQILHVDFNIVDMHHEVTVVVPLAFVGEHAKDIPDRVLVYNQREVEIRCLPTDLPETIEVDVSTLPIGESVKAGDVALPTGATLLTDPELVIVSAVAAKVSQEEPAAEEAVEPEVIKAKADDKDEEA